VEILRDFLVFSTCLTINPFLAILGWILSFDGIPLTALPSGC
jgi:hypothetical protein